MYTNTKHANLSTHYRAILKLFVFYEMNSFAITLFGREPLGNNRSFFANNITVSNETAVNALILQHIFVL